jgi:cytochrome b
MTKVWTPFVRLCHWLLAIAFFTALYYRQSEWDRNIHVMAGYAAGIIIVVRIVWGFIARGYERFSAFPPDPKAAVGYAWSIVEGHPKHYVGHNPAGSVVIYGMLAVGLMTVTTGLAVFNDAYLPISFDTLEYFHEYSAWTWVALVVMHILGVLTESWVQKENLILTMLTGNKRTDQDD